MSDAARRRELRDDHRRRQRVGAVFALHVAATDPVVRSTTDLDALRNRLAFARATGITSALDHRLREHVERLGFDAVRLEVLDVLEPDPTRSAAHAEADLATLEELWRERLATR